MKHFKNAINIAAVLTIVFISCKDDNEDPVNNAVQWDKTPLVIDVGNFPPPQFNSDNLPTVQGVKLGRMLFYESMLSADGSMSCASCHMQEFAFTDTATFSIGVKGLPGKRQAMSVFNTAWHTNEFFWDGRAHLLRDQSLLPIQDELEMNETLENVVAKLSASQMYRNQFVRAFGSDEITAERMSLAMEQFMNTIVSNDSRYDAYLQDSTVFNESEKRGMELFFAEYNPFFPEESGAGCAHCHAGFNFENDQFMNNGLNEDGTFVDEGRKNATGNASDLGRFKVTSLRNIALTAPYMHDGRFKTLEEVVDHYNSGLNASATLDPALEQTRQSGLMLTEQDKADLVAFLNTLTDQVLIQNPDYSNPF